MPEESRREPVGEARRWHPNGTLASLRITTGDHLPLATFEWHESGARIRGHDAVGLDLSGLDLSGVDLSGVNLSESWFTDAKLAGGKLVGSDLYRSDAQGADFSGADLSCASLVRANLDDAVLRGAVLDGTALVKASLCEVDASGASLRGARLMGASLLDVDLRGADLSYAVLRENSFKVTLDRATRVEGLSGTVFGPVRVVGPEGVREVGGAELEEWVEMRGGDIRVRRGRWDAGRGDTVTARIGAACGGAGGTRPAVGRVEPFGAPGPAICTCVGPVVRGNVCGRPRRTGRGPCGAMTSITS
ncbi:pentapeptide repeat-containing protein [Streptomyces sp. MA5143a]|uniref:pentapeptide repeat-containing protein n=1 Tax=Streptomyces sp. MA5143a TaxID=2083010 RepID=UPI000D1BFAAC|nr:pentapeptide repeat-containing protein [Streptomyces sp. MA5143a]SPF03102.1 Type III effector pipB2 [Streptomyces sp. MA5143a]